MRIILEVKFCSSDEQEAKEKAEDIKDELPKYL